MGRAKEESEGMMHRGDRGKEKGGEERRRGGKRRQAVDQTD